jgi:hypothetical protein
MLQSASMVAVSVRDEHIVHRTEVYAHLPGISDEDIAGSCIQQNLIALGLQQHRQSVLRDQRVVAAPIIREYRPLHGFLVLKYAL